MAFGLAVMKDDTQTYECLTPCFFQLWHYPLFMLQKAHGRSLISHESGVWNTDLPFLLVFCTIKGISHEANIFYKRLASLLRDKWKDQ